MVDLLGGACFIIWAIVGYKRLQLPTIAAIIQDKVTGVEYIVTTWGGIHVRLGNDKPQQAAGRSIDATKTGPSTYFV